MSPQEKATAHNHGRPKAYPDHHHPALWRFIYETCQCTIRWSRYPADYPEERWRGRCNFELQENIYVHYLPFGHRLVRPARDETEMSEAEKEYMQQWIHTFMWADLTTSQTIRP